MFDWFKFFTYMIIYLNNNKWMNLSLFIHNFFFTKEEQYGPGINWGDGLKSDPIFVSVWKS